METGESMTEPYSPLELLIALRLRPRLHNTHTGLQNCRTKPDVGEQLVHGNMLARPAPEDPLILGDILAVLMTSIMAIRLPPLMSEALQGRNILDLLVPLGPIHC